MAIIHVYNKARDITYVYESTSYWDKELKQPRSHRKLIGKLDPVTGETIPTGSRGKQVSDVPKSSKRRLHSDTDYKALYENCISSIQHKDDIIAELRDRLKLVEQENKKLRAAIDKAQDTLSAVLTGKR